jgi:hypothetical protein
MAFLWLSSKHVGMLRGGDIMVAFRDFNDGCLFEKSLNDLFISLIPKTPGAIALKDFWSIILVGGIFFFF